MPDEFRKHRHPSVEWLETKVREIQRAAAETGMFAQRLKEKGPMYKCTRVSCGREQYASESKKCYDCWGSLKILP